MSNLNLKSPIIPTLSPQQVIDDVNGPCLVSDVSDADVGVELDVENNDEELEFELEANPSEGQHAAQIPGLKGTTWRWPKRVRKGWSQLVSVTEEVAGLSGFREAVAGCNRL